MIVLMLCLTLCLRIIQGENDLCETYKTCKQCVHSISCQWCSSEDFNNIERCIPIDRMYKIKCSKDQIQNPKGSVKYSTNDDFSSETQLKPQRLKVKLRPLETQTFEFMFKAAKNYPADLYFLYDYSKTMTKTISLSAQASDRIYNKMINKTANVLLGMGIFNDKNTAPFVRDKTPNPVTSFSHKLNLTKDFNQLKYLVDDVANHVEGNMDSPEGGFDALAQVLSCKKEIGWRNSSRKFIFFFTDATSHLAGDARVAGIVRPYDGECYTKNGVYTKELELDYPSVNMINELAVKEGVTIVFIIRNKGSKRGKNPPKSKVLQAYKTLKEKIHGSIVIEFKNDIDNIEDLIIKAYEDTTQTIKLDAVMAPEDHGKFNITFEPDCKNEICTVPVNPTEPFNITGHITLLHYYDKDNINVDVSIQNIKERLSLDIEVADCDCEVKRNSTNCSYHGSKTCGICDCNAGRTGNKCECEIGDASCKQPGVKDVSSCNGRGDCRCGVCECDKGYTGRYCECENNRCVQDCNGHGSCYCGRCTCDPGWTGEYCNCEMKTCKTVKGKECNSRGLCDCGKCKCDPPAKWDGRDSQDYETCEMKCSDCHDSQCLKLKECAICRQSYDENKCSSLCGGIQVKVVETLSNITDENSSICKDIQAGAGCYTRFQYQYDDVNYLINLFIEAEMDCLPSYYRLGGGILVALLVIGLLTLVGWKLLTDYRDRQEYQRFLKMHGADSGGGCQNPIYENPTTTIRNPAFRKPSVDYMLK